MDTDERLDRLAALVEKMTGRTEAVTHSVELLASNAESRPKTALHGWKRKSPPLQTE